MTKLIFLNDISIEDSPKVRDHLNKDAVDEYAEAYKKNSPMPPPQLFASKESKFLLVGDGLHRIEAARSLGRKAMQCDVQTGGFQDALKFALQSNIKHGLRRSQADRRRCIESALKEWPKASDNQIAGLCTVDPKTVAAVRSELESKQTIATTQEREGADGKTYKTGRKPRAQVGNSIPEGKPSNKKDSSPKDEEGHDIPKGLLPLWGRRVEVAAVLRQVSQVKCLIEDVDKKDDPLWRECFLNKAIAELQSVYGNLTMAMPYSICSICQGHPESQPNNECRGCKGRGFMSKFRWERTSDKTKAMMAESK